MNERLNEDPNTTAKFGKSSTKKDPIKKNKERVQSVNTKKKWIFIYYYYINKIEFDKRNKKY